MDLESASCEELFAILSQYLDGELPPDACRQIEGHIAGCPPCVEFVQSLRKSIELCGSYRPNEAPRALDESAKAELCNAWQEARQSRC